MPKLDDASWHWGSDEFPEDLPEQAGATHIGMFVAWAILNGMWSEEPDWTADLEKVRARQMTGSAFLMKVSDGAFVSDDMTPDSAAFAEAYYPKAYMADYQKVLVGKLKSDYLVEDSWANYDLIAAVIDTRWSQTRS